MSERSALGSRGAAAPLAPGPHPCGLGSQGPTHSRVARFAGLAADELCHGRSLATCGSWTWLLQLNVVHGRWMNENMYDTHPFTEKANNPP